MGYEEIIDKIEAYSKRIQDRYHPKMIVVYGSYARGTATDNSDIDIAVICDALPGNYLENAAELFKLRRDIDLRIEPVLIETDNADNRFYNEILRTGKIVYTATA
jgi:predicted nucleotidyltransferase